MMRVRVLPSTPLGLLLAGLFVGLAAGGCGSTSPYTLGPIQTTDPDDRPTDRPEQTRESMYWDRVDMSVFHQLEKPLNLNWTGRTVGRALGLAAPDPADNVNVLDEPPNSSWYKRRHFYDEMTGHWAQRARHDGRGGGARPDRALDRDEREVSGSGPWL